MSLDSGGTCPAMMQPMNPIQEMLDACDRYCAATGKARATVSMLILNDGKFFDRIAAGKDCQIGTHRRVMAWFQEHLPKAEAEAAERAQAKPPAEKAA